MLLHNTPAARSTARELMRRTAVAIPQGTKVPAAAWALVAGGLGAVPVVDSDGRCVGLFTARGYLRWANRAGPAAGLASDPGLGPAGDEVRDHMTREFATATPDAELHELAHRLRGADEPWVVVLDRQRRPMGVVCGMLVLRMGTNRRLESSGFPAAAGGAEL
ncbi:MAG TPA: CBS domain-containing protein [Gemmataceae bacterium]|jgi:CBS-domain-containing membrane protein|nr:CBS domain-containing protein [Gemmataceae bacterium]